MNTSLYCTYLHEIAITWKDVKSPGLVGLDAIPEHKRHLPIGGAENPVPLIEFQGTGVVPQRRPLNKKERQQRKKLLIEYI